MNIETFVGFLLVGFFGTFLGLVAGGGGGALATPLLILLGLPASSAVATRQLGSLPNDFYVAYRFAKEGRIVARYAVFFSILALIGPPIGALFLKQINPVIVEQIVGFALLVMPFVVLKSKLGHKSVATLPRDKAIGGSLYFLSLVSKGFIGGLGTGLLINQALARFFGMTYSEVIGTKRIPGIVSDFSALAGYIAFGLVNYRVAAVLAIGMFLGGYLATHLALRKGEQFIKKFMVAAMFAFGLILLFRLDDLLIRALQNPG